MVHLDVMGSVVDVVFDELDESGGELHFVQSMDEVVCVYGVECLFELRGYDDGVFVEMMFCLLEMILNSCCVVEWFSLNAN